MGKQIRYQKASLISLLRPGMFLTWAGCANTNSK